MRFAGNFHPEWGYLAPAPSFMRTVRIVVIATAVGATAGAVVVLSLVDRPSVAVGSVAARTLARPVQAEALAVSALPRPSAEAAVNAQGADRNPPSAVAAPPQTAAASEAGIRSTPPAAAGSAGIATLAEAPAASEASPTKPTEDPSPAAEAAPVKKKTARKRRPPSHYASRGGPFELVPGGEYYMSGGGYYVENPWRRYYDR